MLTVRDNLCFFSIYNGFFLKALILRHKYDIKCCAVYNCLYFSFGKIVIIYGTVHGLFTRARVRAVRRIVAGRRAAVRCGSEWGGRTTKNDIFMTDCVTSAGMYCRLDWRVGRSSQNRDVVRSFATACGGLGRDRKSLASAPARA